MNENKYDKKVKLSTLLVPLLMSTSCAGFNHYNKTQVINTNLEAGYSLAQTPNAWHQGFEFGVKQVKDSQYKITRRALGGETTVYRSDKSRHSNELSVNFLMFSDDEAMYEFGFTEGFGKYSKHALYNMELLIGLARMAITSNEDIMWTPEVAWGVDLWPFYAQAGIKFYVGQTDTDKNFGAGFFLNSGFSF